MMFEKRRCVQLPLYRQEGDLSRARGMCSQKVVRPPPPAEMQNTECRSRTFLGQHRTHHYADSCHPNDHCHQNHLYVHQWLHTSLQKNVFRRNNGRRRHLTMAIMESTDSREHPKARAQLVWQHTTALLCVWCLLSHRKVRRNAACTIASSFRRRHLQLRSQTPWSAKEHRRFGISVRRRDLGISFSRDCLLAPCLAAIQRLWTHETLIFTLKSSSHNVLHWFSRFFSVFRVCVTLMHFDLAPILVTWMCRNLCYDSWHYFSAHFRDHLIT